MTDICFLARFAYEQGEDPVDYAVHGIVESHVDAWLTIRAARERNPRAYPGYLLPMTTDVLARRIVGDLLDAGWTPPEVTK